MEDILTVLSGLLWGIAAADEEALHPACYQGDLLSAFMHSSLVYVSFWQLQVLDLGGPVHLDTVLPVLPTALLDLTLRPFCKHMPIKCCLAPFERFSQLTSLAIGFYDKSPAKHVKGSFVLNVCLPTLESLSLDPWPIEAHEDHPFTPMFAKCADSHGLCCLQQGSESGGVAVS